MGQLKVNNHGVLCQMSMKLPAMSDQNSLHTFDKIVEKQITKNALKLDLEPKCQGNSRNQKTMTWGTKHATPKTFEQRVSNWCDAEVNADADSSKTMLSPTLRVLGRHNNFIYLKTFILCLSDMSHMKWNTWFI